MSLQDRLAHELARVSEIRAGWAELQGRFVVDGVRLNVTPALRLLDTTLEHGANALRVGSSVDQLDALTRLEAWRDG